jgi:cobalt-zinc-cadmium efflux system outer membrane protein
MPIKHLSGELDLALEDYNLDQVSTYVLSIHPEIRSAQIGVEHARLILQRAKVEPIPNITVGTGYTRQSQNRSDDWDIGFSVPLPLWNKNQGNILSAETNINVAMNQTERVQNELMDQLAIAYSAYASARERAERYQVSILPKAQRTYELSMVAYQGGQFEYLRVLEAQRSVAEANLELIRSMSEMWLAASEIAGLMLEDQWPLAPVPPLPEKEQS